MKIVNINSVLTFIHFKTQIANSYILQRQVENFLYTIVVIFLCHRVFYQHFAVFDQ